MVPKLDRGWVKVFSCATYMWLRLGGLFGIALEMLNISDDVCV